jgi:hypothetical protein
MHIASATTGPVMEMTKADFSSRFMAENFARLSSAVRVYERTADSSLY